MLDYSPTHKLNDNRLLSLLPDGKRYLLAHYFEPVELSKGQILDASEPYAYFPHDAVISLVSSMADEQTELAMVGFDGATGVYNALGFNSLQYKCVVRVPGRADRIESSVLRERSKRDGDFSALLMQYLHALYAQIAQVAICYRRHRLQQRLQTWMTMMFNRLPTGNLKMKQDEIAETLGYARQSVSAATVALQETGIIQYSRGHINLLNRERLAQGACECCSIMESHYERIALPEAAPKPASQDIDSVLSMTELASLYIEQLDTTIKNVRKICNRQDSVLQQQLAKLKLNKAIYQENDFSAEKKILFAKQRAKRFSERTEPWSDNFFKKPKAHR